MRKITTTNKVLTITILVLTVLFIFTKNKIWNYKQKQSIEYNEEYNEKYPVIDTLSTLYKNINENNPIKIRRFVIDGHSVSGEINGGSRVITVHDIPNCEKCRVFFISLLSERKPNKNNRDSTSSSNTVILP